MSKRRVFSNDVLPVRSPIPTTLLVALAVSHWEIDGPALGAIAVLMVGYWIGALIRVANEERITPTGMGEVD